MSLGVSYDRWQSQQHDEIPPVILACGPEAGLKDTFVDNLLESSDEDPERVTLYADETTPEDLVQELRGQGLFNEEKWIVLKQLDRKGSGGKRQLERFLPVLEEYVESPEPGTRLILLDADHPYRKGRKTGTLARAVEGNGGWAIIFWEPFDDSLRETARDRFEEAGLDVDPPALQRLLERTRGKYGRLVAEVEKLVDAVEGRVSVEAVDAVVSREKAQDAFDSVKTSLVTGNLSRMMTDLDDFWRQGESPPRIVHVLYQFLNDLRAVRRLKQEGASLEDALSERGRPTSRTVKELYKKGLSWVRKGFEPSFYRDFYGVEKASKYARDGLDEHAVETLLLELASPR